MDENKNDTKNKPFLLYFYKCISRTAAWHTPHSLEVEGSQPLSAHQICLGFIFNNALHLHWYDPTRAIHRALRNDWLKLQEIQIWRAHIEKGPLLRVPSKGCSIKLIRPIISTNTGLFSDSNLRYCFLNQVPPERDLVSNKRCSY